MSEKSRRSARGSRASDAVRRPTGRTDWARVDATTDAEIAAQIAGDPDTAPELDAGWLASADAAAAPPKQPISLRMDPDVLAWFRAQGSGYQSRMNAVLRAYAEHHGLGQRALNEPRRHAAPLNARLTFYRC